MKILIASDIHLAHYKKSHKVIYKLKKYIDANNFDVFCIAGDISEVSFNTECYKDTENLLKLHKNTIFVLGNHDIWNTTEHRYGLLDPIEAMTKHMELYFKGGFPLETKWEDEETIVQNGGVTFVGSMGFPDFCHPYFNVFKNMFNKNGTTNDISYIKILHLGWLYYTDKMMNCFKKRLEKACKTGDKTIVVLTHYAIFDNQVYLINDDVSPYFFNYTMGRYVLEFAQQYPDKNFICICGHSHDFCMGEIRKSANNVFVYGHKNDYQKLMVTTIDTDNLDHREVERVKIY